MLLFKSQVRELQPMYVASWVEDSNSGDRNEKDCKVSILFSYLFEKCRKNTFRRNKV